MENDSTDQATGPLTVVTANIDGIESATKKGFFRQAWIESADVLCLQETRSSRTEQIGKDLVYNVAVCDREEGKHGGVAIFSRRPITDVQIAGEAIRARGQFVSCLVAGVRIASVYVTLDCKPEQYIAFQPLFDEMLQTGRAIIAGDFNTFRDGRDSWRFAEANQRGEDGCHPLAMGWFKRLFTDGWIDSVALGTTKRPLYTWWSSERYRNENKGTRVDYQLITPDLMESVIKGMGTVHTTVRRGRHAQISVSYRLRETKLDQVHVERAARSGCAARQL